MKHTPTVDRLVNALPLCHSAAVFFPQDVCSLRCCCKALRDGLAEEQITWGSYPLVVSVPLHQLSAAVWLARHATELQRLCFSSAWEPLLRNIFKLLDSKASLRYLEIKGDEGLVSLPRIPGTVQELNLAWCIGLRELPPLPPSLNILDCLGCASLVSLPKPLPSQLQRLSLGSNHVKHLPPLPAALTRLELAECGSIRQLWKGRHALPANLRELQLRCDGSSTQSSIPKTRKQTNSGALNLQQLCVQHAVQAQYRLLHVYRAVHHSHCAGQACGILASLLCCAMSSSRMQRCIL